VFVWVEALPGKFVFGIAFAQAGEEAGEGSGGDCKRGRDGIVGFRLRRWSPSFAMPDDARIPSPIR
jgi:hypothetical protein